MRRRVVRLMDALPVRSPREKIGGLVHFGRMLHKLRLHAQDRLSPDYVDRLGCGLDGRDRLNLIAHHDSRT